MKAVIKRAGDVQEYFFAEGCFIQELSNSSDDGEVSIAQARLAPGNTTRWHHIVATGERYVILAGEGVVEIGDVPAQRVAAGDVVVIPPGVRQRIHNPGTVDLLFLAICSPRFVESAYVDGEAQ